MVAEGDGNDDSVGIMCKSSQPPLNPILDEIHFCSKNSKNDCNNNSSNRNDIDFYLIVNSIPYLFKISSAEIK